jgi:hypothetical protein
VKPIRVMLVLLLALVTLTPATRSRAATDEVASTVSAGDGAGTPALATTPDGSGGPTSKGGVIAAAGCGFAVASLVLAPNPISAFMVGFDCGFMLIDAISTPDQ